MSAGTLAQHHTGGIVEGHLVVGIRPEAALARWAAQLAPVVAIEAIIARLDAGNPTQARAAVKPGGFNRLL
jgi:hypothetical protein